MIYLRSPGSDGNCNNCHPTDPCASGCNNCSPGLPLTFYLTFSITGVDEPFFTEINGNTYLLTNSNGLTIMSVPMGPCDWAIDIGSLPPYGRHYYMFLRYGTLGGLTGWYTEVDWYGSGNAVARFFFTTPICDPAGSAAYDYSNPYSGGYRLQGSTCVVS